MMTKSPRHAVGWPGRWRDHDATLQPSTIDGTVYQSPCASEVAIVGLSPLKETNNITCITVYHPTWAADTQVGLTPLPLGVWLAYMHRVMLQDLFRFFKGPGLTHRQLRKLHLPGACCW
jgi:hypothetical protein